MTDTAKAIGFFLFVIFLCVVWYMVGKDAGRDNERRDAIKVGAAHYIADESGQPKFEWNTKP